MYLLLHMLCIVLSAGDIGMMILISAGIIVDGDVVACLGASVDS